MRRWWERELGHVQWFYAEAMGWCPFCHEQAVSEGRCMACAKWAECEECGMTLGADGWCLVAEQHE